MCEVCNARNNLLAVSGRLQDNPLLADIGLKFAEFAGWVKGSIYSEDAEKNKAIKIRCLTLATSFAEGYLLMHEKGEVMIKSMVIPQDHRKDVRNSLVKAVIELYRIFGPRLPWAFYGGYLFMAARPNLEVPERLPEIQGLLPATLPWECVDAVWHGLPPATKLYMSVLSVFSSIARTVPMHGCGCNHYLPPVPPDLGGYNVSCPPLSAEEIRTETEVPVSHMLVALENLARGLPHALGETEKSLDMHARRGMTVSVTPLIEIQA